MDRRTAERDPLRGLDLGHLLLCLRGDGLYCCSQWRGERSASAWKDQAGEINCGAAYLRGFFLFGRDDEQTDDGPGGLSLGMDYNGGSGGGFFDLEICTARANCQRVLGVSDLAPILPWLRRLQSPYGFGKGEFAAGSVVSSAGACDCNLDSHLSGFSGTMAAPGRVRLDTALRSQMAEMAAVAVVGQLDREKSSAGGIWN